MCYNAQADRNTSEGPQILRCFTELLCYAKYTKETASFEYLGKQKLFMS